MDGDQAVSVVAMLGGLVLVGSALIARRMSFGRLGRFAIVWIVIFVVATAITAFLMR